MAGRYQIRLQRKPLSSDAGATAGSGIALAAIRIAGHAVGTGGGHSMKNWKRHDRGVAVVASLWAAACGSMTDDPAPVTAAGALCDGSSEVRLTYKSVGGFVDAPYAFYAPQGMTFFAVDGGCHYWAGGDLNTGLRTGTLSAEMADSTAAALHVNEIPALAAHQDTESCPDAGGAYLGAQGRFISCTCGCDDLPAAIPQSFRNADTLGVSLLSAGAPSDGPLRALAIPVDDPKGPAPAKILDWPLAASPSTLATGPMIAASSGKAIEAPADRMALRNLRVMAGQLAGFGPIYVRAIDGALFSLYLRDELPAPVAQALTTLGSP
jgi:hypothetical protein